ncbi:hypothetical protein VP01_5700g1 [Puccinia sorghi]|uniref:Uncharacterized protein n=1 Tax=Puccinia sorghi TaxID=27349 RepID=A0A0L6UJE6_9BASI|nr:hypothetical protein VP01_5700g1 [Puccinia sorghi]
MKSIGLRVMFCLLFNFSQIWLASAAPQEGKPGKDSFKSGPNTSGAGSQDKPLMGVGIGADGTQNPKPSQVIQKYFQVLTPANGKSSFGYLVALLGTMYHLGDLWKAILANLTLDLPNQTIMLKISNHVVRKSSNTPRRTTSYFGYTPCLRTSFPDDLVDDFFFKEFKGVEDNAKEGGLAESHDEHLGTGDQTVRKPGHRNGCLQ